MDGIYNYRLEAVQAATPTIRPRARPATSKEVFTDDLVRSYIREDLPQVMEDPS